MFGIFDNPVEEEVRWSAFVNKKTSNGNSEQGVSLIFCFSQKSSKKAVWHTIIFPESNAFSHAAYQLWTLTA